MSYVHIIDPNRSKTLHLLSACTSSLSEAGTETMREVSLAQPAMTTVIDYHVLYRDIICKDNDHT